MVVEFLYKEAMSAKKQQKEKLTNNNKWLFFSPTLPNFKLLLSSKSNQNLPFFPNKIWNPSLSRRVQAYPWKDIWINSLLHSVFCYFLRRQFFFSFTHNGSVNFTTKAKPPPSLYNKVAGASSRSSRSRSRRRTINCLTAPCYVWCCVFMGFRAVKLRASTLSKPCPLYLSLSLTQPWRLGQARPGQAKPRFSSLSFYLSISHSLTYNNNNYNNSNSLIT